MPAKDHAYTLPSSVNLVCFNNRWNETNLPLIIFIQHTFLDKKFPKKLSKFREKQKINHPILIVKKHIPTFFGVH